MWAEGEREHGVVKEGEKVGDEETQEEELEEEIQQQRRTGGRNK